MPPALQVALRLERDRPWPAARERPSEGLKSGGAAPEARLSLPGEVAHLCQRAL